MNVICDTFNPGDGLTLPSASALGAVDTVFQLLGRNPRGAEKKQLVTLLNLWDSRLTGLLTGSGLRRFSRLSQEERERALLRLADSRFESVRVIFGALKQASLLSYNITPGPAVVVADASSFPTASGVNPMVSIEAIAYMNAKRLVARLS